MPKHPRQPVVMVDGIARFQANEIVRYLLERGPFNMNDLALLPFKRKDREQFAQLIGYSVSGAHDLEYVSDELIAKADRDAVRLVKGKKR